MRNIALSICIASALASALLAAPKKSSPMADRLKASNKAYNREIRTDYDTIPGMVIHWFADGHAKTNKPFRADCHTVTNCWELTLADERKVANYVRKAQKDAEKAEKKDQKNFENWLKDTKKAMDKSSEDMKDFYADIIFFATNRNVNVEAK